MLWNVEQATRRHISGQAGPGRQADGQTLAEKEGL